MSPRPGFVLEVDRSTPPTLMWHGEGFRLERLPVGTRVVYGPEPISPLADPDAAIRHALDHPLGDAEPLAALLRPGMRLTIAFDDISLPLPPMRAPDVRQRVIEAVLDLAAAGGVDDVVLIAALALHRRMTDAELRHALGDRVFEAFAPHGLLLQHDAEDPANLVHLGVTDHGEDVEINRRAAESDLLVYVNINLVAMDGGHKSVATGLASYRSIQHHHNVRTMQHSRSFMDVPHSELHTSNWRMGRLIAESGVKIFQIETTLNTDTFPEQFGFLQKREWEWTIRDRAAFVASSTALDRTPGELTRRIFHAVRSPHNLTSVQAGEVEAVHESHSRQRPPPAARRGQGPDRRAHDGAALHLPVQRQLDHEPDPRRLPRARLLLQPLPGQAARTRGWRGDHVAPDAVGVQPGAPPELHRLLRAGARRDDRPVRDRGEVRGVLRHRPVVHPPLPDELRLPRRPSVLHVVLVRARSPAPRAR